MAIKSLCKIDGCDKPARKRGWCHAHYERWRAHGNPLAGRDDYGQARDFYRNVVLAYDGGDCLIWPFARCRNGYGRMNIAGVPRTVSRLVCKEVKGLPPSDRHEAAHLCGNGHLGCVTPKHIVWKTHAENQADKVQHGTLPLGEQHHQSKLSNQDVLNIRKMFGVVTQRRIARMYGVSEMTISDIKHKRNWGWLV